MRIVQGLLLFVYPVLIYLALRYASPRTVALVALGILGLRLAVTSPRQWIAYARAGAWPVVVMAAALAATGVWNDPRALLIAPALGSFALLFAFAGSLLRSESVVEGIARASLGSLDPEQSRYCRRVTGLWSIFFLANGIVSLLLALRAPLEAWALYTGLLSYLLIGLLFAGEFTYRHWRFRTYVGAPTDPLFQRLFPPRAE